MNLTVYVPKELEEELRQRAEAESLSPSLYVQSVLRRALEATPRQMVAISLSRLRKPASRE